MKPYVIYLMMSFCCIISGYGQIADHPVISEIRYDERSGINEEFIELYNPTPDTIGLNGWSIDYMSKTGTSWRSKVMFEPHHYIRPFGFFLWGGSAVDPVPDVMEENQSALGLSNSGGHAAIRNADGEIVDVVAWEGGQFPEGAADAGQTGDGGSLERKAGAASTAESMRTGGSEENAGNGYDSDQNGDDFIVHPAADVRPQNMQSAQEPDPSEVLGSGKAALVPDWAYGNLRTDITLMIWPGAGNMLEQAAVLMPWTFSGTADIRLSEVGNSSELQQVISEDTLFISGFHLIPGDTLTIRFNEHPVPDFPGNRMWRILTGPKWLPVSNSPVMRILDAPQPILPLHENDPSGLSLYAGNRVSLHGIITAGTGMFSASMTDCYLQDSTAGIKIFSEEAPFHFMPGDEVVISGTLDQFRGMTELRPDWSCVLLRSRDNALPEPVVLTCKEVSESFNQGFEANEGRLVLVENSVYDPDCAMLTDSTGSCSLYADPDAGIVMPNGRMHVQGILTQYKPGAGNPDPPYTGDYAVQPRIQTDIIPLTALQFVLPPGIIEWSDDGIAVRLETNEPCDVLLVYGQYDQKLGQIESAKSAVHEIRISGLNPACIYYYQIYCRRSPEEIRSPEVPFVTRSGTQPENPVKVYFNGTVTAQTNGNAAAGNENLYDRLAELIQAAVYSIDFCFMKLTDWDIRDDLIEAHRNGVMVRAVIEEDEMEASEIQALKEAGIQVVNESLHGSGDGLMHHKFAVFDHRDRSSLADDIVWTGSFNPVYYGSYPQPYENVTVIRDAALAAVYTAGFEMIFGNGMLLPDIDENSGLFRKLPSQVAAGKTMIDVYFSPDGGAGDAIEAAMATVDYSVHFCMFSFTKNRLADVLISRSQECSFPVLGVMDADQVISDKGFSQWEKLSAAFSGSVIQYTASRMLHHKYAVLDGQAPESDPMVITGSYNWSHSAETRNYENLLIIHSSQIAEQYEQEFSARYDEATRIEDRIPEPICWQLNRNYPNPFNASTEFTFDVPQQTAVTIQVFDVRGRMIRQLFNEPCKPGRFWVLWDGSDTWGRPVSSGVYIICLTSRYFSDRMKVICLK